jgi:Protein kinase domain
VFTHSPREVRTGWTSWWPRLTLPIERLMPPFWHHFINQILSAFTYLASQSIIHGDLNRGNFLCDTTDMWVLSDFGRAHRDHEEHQRGARLYSAPETTKELGRDGFAATQSDVWSLGVVALELIESIPSDSTAREDRRGYFAEIFRLSQGPSIPEEVREMLQPFERRKAASEITRASPVVQRARPTHTGWPRRGSPGHGRRAPASETSSSLETSAQGPRHRQRNLGKKSTGKRRVRLREDSSSPPHYHSPNNDSREKYRVHRRGEAAPPPGRGGGIRNESSLEGHVNDWLDQQQPLHRHPRTGPPQSNPANLGSFPLNRDPRTGPPQSNPANLGSFPPNRDPRTGPPQSNPANLGSFPPNRDPRTGRAVDSQGYGQRDWNIGQQTANAPNVWPRPNPVVDPRIPDPMSTAYQVDPQSGYNENQPTGPARNHPLFDTGFRTSGGMGGYNIQQPHPLNRDIPQRNTRDSSPSKSSTTSSSHLGTSNPPPEPSQASNQATQRRTGRGKGSKEKTQKAGEAEKAENSTRVTKKGGKMFFRREKPRQ